MKIYILHLRQDNIVTHIGHHGCVYDIISSNVLKGTQSNTELGNIHNTGNTLQYNTIQYNVSTELSKEFYLYQYVDRVTKR